jgi:signal transduction histidine kinase
MLRFDNSSIAQKLARLNALVSGTALLLACAGFFVYDFYSFRAEAVRNLGMQAEIIGANSISALVFDDPRAAEKTLSALQAAPHVMLAEIHTPDGQTFASYRRDAAAVWPDALLIPAGRVQVQGFWKEQVFLARTLAFEGRNIGTVRILADSGAMKHRKKNFGLLVVMVLLASLGTTMWISSIARRSIAEPIVQLSNVARMISREKNYSARAPAIEAQDEVSGLVTTFNEMLEQIQTRDAALRTAHDELERRVHERTAQLNAANADLEAFSYSVSHDLRAPLRHISAFSKMMSEEYGAGMDPGAKNYLQRIQDRAKRMAELIEDLLNMAQIGRNDLALARTDLNDLLRNVMAEMQPECDGRKIDWKISRLPEVECEPGLMKQVLTNLLGNAVKYSRRREVAVIEVGTLEQDGAPVVFVRDNGAGFDAQYADKLFGVFQRLHRSEEFEGTGVGLATVKRILQKHGGKIWATSEVDNGATFFFSLPRSATTTDLRSAASAAV